MINLLRANFARLFRFRPLWICVILSIAVSFINDITFAITMNKDWIYKTGDLIINQVGTIAMFLAAIFASLYLGTEYAHGTIRNKLASGHSRAGTYFANLIPVTTGSLIIYAAYCAPLVVMSLIWGKDLGMEVGDFCMQILIIVAAAIAISSIFTLLGILITSRSIATTVTLVLMFVMFQGSMILLGLLEKPKYISDNQSAAAITVTSEPNLNPEYIKEGVIRDTLTAVIDVLPSGQMMRLKNNAMHNKELYPLYSIGVLAVSTTAGVLVFRRRDLK